VPVTLAVVPHSFTTPLILGRTMNSDGRSRRRELVEEAYNLQVKAGLMASRIPFRYYHS
jgi:hypothetical protein